MGTIPTPADNGNEASYVARANLARSILNQRLSVPDCDERTAELAVYEAQMALAGQSPQAIADWHSLAAR